MVAGIIIHGLLMRDKPYTHDKQNRCCKWHAKGVPGIDNLKLLYTPTSNTLLEAVLIIECKFEDKQCFTLSPHFYGQRIQERAISDHHVSVTGIVNRKLDRRGHPT